jgi:hypothetical protein
MWWTKMDERMMKVTREMMALSSDILDRTCVPFVAYEQKSNTYVDSCAVLCLFTFLFAAITVCLPRQVGSGSRPAKQSVRKNWTWFQKYC